MSELQLRAGFHKPEENLPKDWYADQIGLLCNVNQGGKLGLTKESHYVSNGIPAYSAAGQDGFVNIIEYDNINGVVLSAIGANCGKCFYAEEKWTTLANTQAIIPSQKINAKFLYYRINREDYWTRSGSAQPFIKPSDIKKSWVAVPKDIHEQNKIATILSTIDETIEHTEALIEKYQHIKAGMMNDLFTRGVLPDGTLRPTRDEAPELYHETPIGWIPKEWGCKKLNKILFETGGYLQTGPFGSQLHSHEYTKEGIPVIMPQDIESGLVLIDKIAKIPENRANSLSRHRVKIGDIIIARRGDLSRASAISNREEGWVCGTGCFLLRLSGCNLNTNFFSYIYRHDMIQRQIEGLAVGTTMPSLNNNVMKNLYFPYLNPQEQDNISERVNILESNLFSLNNHLLKLQKQKSGLIHDLLTGEIRVKTEDADV